MTGIVVVGSAEHRRRTAERVAAMVVIAKREVADESVFSADQIGALHDMLDKLAMAINETI